MTKRTYGHTESGTPIADEVVEQLADEAEAGYDVDEIIAAAVAGDDGLARNHRPSSRLPSTPSSRSGCCGEPRSEGCPSPR